MLNWKKIRLRCAVGSGLWTLAFLTVTAVPAVPALAGVFTDKDPKVRREAAMSLAKSGPAAKSAVPALKKALKDGNREVRDAANIALRRIG